jgi:hypothetical protein
MMVNIVEVPNPFDPESLRLSQDFAKAAGVKKLLNIVPVRKPSNQDFVRTHPNSEYQITTAIIELKEDGEIFLVAPELRNELAAEYLPMKLFTAINRQGNLFLWPCKLPRSDGRTNRWSESCLEGAELAQTRWLRISADMNVGAYQFYEPIDKLPDPEWPDYIFGEILKVAFSSRYIDSLNHPIVKRLRGME